MKIAIRLDDITPDMDWTRFLQMKNLLDAYEIKPLLGVVPCNQDPSLHKEGAREDFWNYLIQLQEEGYVLALHGYKHVYTTKKAGLFPLNHNSEFAGIPYAQQKNMLMQGMKILESHGIHTDLFMAPSHSFDKNTLRALKELGFKGLTDGFGSMPYDRNGLTFYPISFLLSHSLKRKSGYTTMVVHTNMMSESDMQRYSYILKRYGNQFISYREMINLPSKKRNVLIIIVEYIIAFSKMNLIYIKNRLIR